MNKYLAEIIGTFILVFAGTGAIIVNDISGGSITHVGVSLTFGLVVMAMIYAIGDISGAHLNPAVSCGFFVARRFPGRQTALYIVCQLIGAVLASGALHLLFPDHLALGSTRPTGSPLQSFVLEMILTAILMWVVLCVSAGSKEAGLMAGIAIGGVVAFEAMLGGPISGASMNPARSLGPAIVSGHLSHLWIYLTAPILGAVSAVGIWRIVKSPL